MGDDGKISSMFWVENTEPMEINMFGLKIKIYPEAKDNTTVEEARDE